MKQKSNLEILSTRQALAKLAAARFPTHPFERGISAQNLPALLQNYFAMSQAFPYLQAASQRNLIFDVIERNRDVPVETEITTAVANFLTWDEVGGHAAVCKQGDSKLTAVLQTRKFFHANLLRKDIEKILGRSYVPDYSPVTREYLLLLYEGLASLDHVRRCATMVAFELHAGRMIDALWNSIINIYPIEKESLQYFHAHVGGDDPAEEHHIEITNEMIRLLVPTRRSKQFGRLFVDSYQTNFEWCSDICSLN